MFGSSNRAAAYKQVGVQTGVAAASPHQLILMLYDGALVSVSSAVVALDNDDQPTRGRCISKAIEIIGNGLMASLNLEAGGDLAVKLMSLYDYMLDRLFHANLKNDRAALEEVASLLRELKTAWEEIESQVAHAA